MSLTTANVDVKDDLVGTRDTELGGLMIREDELTIQGCELLSKLIKQSTKGDVSFFLPPVVPSPPLIEGFLHYIVLFGPSWSYTC